MTKCSNIPETFSSASVTDSVRFCHLCHKIVSTNLEQHFQLFHHRCSVCSKLFNYRHDLALHMNFHIDKSKVHECIKSSVNTFELDDDELSESCKDQPFKCKEPGCTTSFQIKRYLTDHIRRVHNVRRFVCQFGGCNKAYKNNFDYIKHLKLHEEKSAGPGIKISKSLIFFYLSLSN